jgi:hypothetical protein
VRWGWRHLSPGGGDGTLIPLAQLVGVETIDPSSSPSNSDSNANKNLCVFFYFVI